MTVAENLKAEEGFKPHVYPDTLGWLRELTGAVPAMLKPRSSFEHWPGRSNFHRPSLMHASRISRTADPMLLGDVPPKNAIGALFSKASIRGLFGQRHPRAVVWIVAKRIGFSFYRKVISIAIGKRPGTERGEVVPFIAYAYSECAVVPVAMEIRIVAARPHRLPNAMQSGAAVAVPHHQNPNT